MSSLIFAYRMYELTWYCSHKMFTPTPWTHWYLHTGCMSSHDIVVIKCFPAPNELTDIYSMEYMGSCVRIVRTYMGCSMFCLVILRDWDNYVMVVSGLHPCSGWYWDKCLSILFSSCGHLRVISYSFMGVSDNLVCISAVDRNTLHHTRKLDQKKGGECQVTSGHTRSPAPPACNGWCVHSSGPFPILSTNDPTRTRTHNLTHWWRLCCALPLRHAPHVPLHFK